jgi:hypothetical protein
MPSIVTDFNTLHPNLKFTAEMEHNNTINFVDTTIHKTQDNIKISIYRKPTFTDTIIPYTSNHPQICCSQIPVQQTEHLPTTHRGVQTGRKHNP